MKRPSFQFYPGDWWRDAALRSISVGARGLWIDMLCLMHEGTPYGHLKVGDKVILPPNLARIVGATLPEVEGWLAELESVAAFDRLEDGCICSRRMVRDEIIRESRASGGKLGGNPALKDKHKDNQKDNLPPNLPPTPASASASASASSKRKATRLPEDLDLIESVKDWAKSNGHDRLPERLEHFLGYVRANDKRYVDWMQAFQNAVRDNWAKLPPSPKSTFGKVD